MKCGQITHPDKLFKDLASDIGWSEMHIEIGTELGLPDKVLRNELETGIFITWTGSKKVIKMLQLWQQNSVTDDDFTYSRLAAALTKHGFHDAALKYCCD